MYSEAYSAAIRGIEGCVIEVETDISDGLPGISLVGFLSSEVKEAKERVRTAIKNSGIKIPAKKMIINLSPADMRKAGTAYDVAIAVSILSALGLIGSSNIKKTMFIGELSLDGRVMAVDGVLPMVYTAYENGFEYCVVPKENVCEALVVDNIKIICIERLLEIVEIFNMDDINQFVEKRKLSFKEQNYSANNKVPDFKDVSGQKSVRRAAEVAVSGMHNFLIVGPPGTGKTMIAKRIPGIMPEPSFEECMEISKIYSVSGLLSREEPVMLKRPFRAPHHTITQSALAGGGRYPKPGEISLASGGVLFLDELPEFNRQTLEVLRQPLEDGYVNVSRVDGTYTYPASCQLVAAMNPCRCGYFPDRTRCKCSQMSVKNYLGRVSRPFLDRIDICSETVSLKYDEISGKTESKANESSADIRQRVKNVHRVQRERYREEDFKFNSQMKPADVAKYCITTKSAQDYINEIFENMSFSARAYHKILKVSRTIADMDGCEMINDEHIAEAVCYRSIDKKYWGAELG